MTTPPAARHALDWFEIPVLDLDRAQAFYETLLDQPLRRETLGEQTLAVLPYAHPGVGGALIAGPQVAPPSPQGTLVYLNVDPSLDAAIARAVAAGARLLAPRTELPADMGCIATLLDTEGNRIGLHALA